MACMSESLSSQSGSKGPWRSSDDSEHWSDCLKSWKESMPSGKRNEPSGSGAPGNGVAPRLGNTRVLVTVLGGCRAGARGPPEAPRKNMITGYIDKRSHMPDVIGSQFFLICWRNEFLLYFSSWPRGSY